VGVAKTCPNDRRRVWTAAGKDGKTGPLEPDKSFKKVPLVADGEDLRKLVPSSKESAEGVTPLRVVVWPFNVNCVVKWEKSQRMGPNVHSQSMPKMMSQPPNEIK